MEGREISVVKLSEVKSISDDFRVEAEHFQHKYSHLLGKLSKNFKYLKELVAKPIQTGHTPSMKNDSFYGGNIKFVKTDNLRDNDIRAPFTDYLTDKGNRTIKRTELKEGDIITTIIGATHDVIARSCMVLKSHLPANINQNIAHIRPDTAKINPAYLSIYLNSKHGKMHLEYLSRQMEQVNLNCDEVGRVKVPIFSENFQNQIENIAKTANEKLEKAKELYAEAEKRLLRFFSIENWIPQNKLTSTKTLSEVGVSGRFDAEFYQPKYDEIENVIENLNAEPLIASAKIKKNNFKPCDSVSYKYIELADIGSNGEINSCTISCGADLPSRARKIVHQGEVLISSLEGSLQSCALVPEEYDNALCSTGFIILKPDTINAETLLVLMKTSFMQQLLKKRCSGTILMAIAEDELAKIQIPLISDEVQSDIAQKVQESFRLRAESKQLLKDAIQMVEKAIENGEQKSSNEIQWDGHSVQNENKIAADSKANFNTKKN